MKPSYIFLFGACLFFLFSGFLKESSSSTYPITLSRQLIINGLVAYYPMDGNGLDSLGTNNGTVQGLASTTSRFGNPGEAMAVEEKSDYMTITPINTENLTVSFWYYYEDPGDTWNTLLCRNGGSFHHLLINYNGAAKHELGFWKEGWYSSGYKLTPKNWYFITLIKEGTRSRIYIGESLIMDSDVSFSNVTYPLDVIGNNTYGSPAQGALGKLDEIRIYDRALTESEIAILYDGGGYSALDGHMVDIRPEELSIINEGPVTVEGIVQNVGQTAINSGSIQWEVNGVVQAAVTFSNENLALLDSVSLNLGTYNFIPGQTYSIRTWLTDINGSTDENPLNDTIAIEQVFVNPAQPHYGVAFDGINDYAILDDGIAQEIAAVNEATFEFWFKAPSHTGSDFLFSVQPNSNSNVHTIMLGILDGRMSVYDGGNNRSEIQTTGRYDDDAYHHLAYVKTGLTGNLYVDGNFVGQHTVNYNFQADDKYSLAQEYDGINTPSQFFEGIIDEVRIWKTARTEAEIREWMVKTIDLGTQPGLVAAYHCGETVNNKLYELNNRYHGILINEPHLVASDAPVSDNRALNDAGASAILLPDSLASKAQALTAVIYNYGKAELEQAEIHWAVNNNLQSTYSWNGNLATHESDTVSIGLFEFEDTRSYQLRVWTEAPNNSPDFRTQNDSISTDIIYSTLSGAYTVGGIDPDFTTLAAAVEALNIGGISEAVTFNIRSGIYEEQLHITEFTGTSCERPVIFQAETQDSSDVLIRFASSSTQNYLVQVDGADGIVLQHLSFEALNATYSRIIEMGNRADCLQLQHSILKASLINTNSTHQALLFSPTGNAVGHQTHISHNTFEGGSRGIWLESTNGDRSTQLIIENNRFLDQSFTGIGLRYLTDPGIRQNFIHTTNNRTDYYGIYMNYVNNAFDINSNKLLVNNGGYGIYLDQCFGLTSRYGLIGNNAIWIGGGNTYAAGVDLRTTSEYINIYHNSIQISSTNASSTTLFFYWYFLYNFVSNINVINNNLVNSGGGLVMRASQGNSPGAFFSNYNNLYTEGGSTLISVSGTHATLADWQTSSGFDQNSLSIDPRFFGEQDLRVALPALDNAGTPLAEVGEDILGQERNPATPDIGAYEFGLLPNDVGILNILSPSPSDCGATLSDSIKVSVVNYSTTPKSNFTLSYRFGTDIVTETFEASIPSGQTALFTFDQPISLSDYGEYSLTVYTQLSEDQRTENDTIRNYHFERWTSPASVANMIPEDAASDLDLPLTFSWAPAEYAQVYDIYIWPSGQSRPAQPVASDLDRIRYTYFGALEYGNSYQWQVVSKNDCEAVDGTIQTFALRSLPDLVVESIEIPSGVLYAGQEIEVQYTVRNIGMGSTEDGEWHETLFFSSDDELQISEAGLNNGDPYIGSNANPSILLPDETYNGQFTFTLPRQQAGPHWLLFNTDFFKKVKEENDDNNMSDFIIDVTMGPNPDLVVSTVRKPIAASIYSSGDQMVVEWEVTNEGDSIITNTSWIDRVFLTQDPTLDPLNAIVLGNYRVQVDTLRPGDSTIASDAFQLPDILEGNFHVFVETDTNNDIFEFTQEDNNISGPSAEVTIIQQAFSDLVISDYSNPSSASNKDTVTFSWEVTNQGAVGTDNYQWYDQVSLSEDDQLSSGDHSFNIRHTGRLESDSSYLVTQNIVIPNRITGTYQVLFSTDSRNYEFEFINENNNTSISPIVLDIRSPDLTVDNISVEGDLISGNEVNINWRVLNQGNGTLHRVRSTNRITLISDLPDSEPVPLALKSEYLRLEPGEGMNFSQPVQLPDGLEGNYYVDIRSDYYEAVYETNEDNNSALFPINLSLAAYPDLQASISSISNPIVAGASMTLTYAISNWGDNAITNEIRRDQIYISDQPSLNSESAILLGTIAQNEDMAVGAIDTVSTQVNIPPDLISGTYYLFVFTNSDGNIYEHGNDKLNNTTTGQSLTILPYPPVDLVITNFEIDFTEVSSGKPFTIRYTANNHGEAATIPASWRDGVYLSQDLIWSPVTDQLIGEIVHNGKLATGDEYMGQQQLRFPNNLSGNFYIFLVIDHRKVINDADFTSNVQSYHTAVDPDEPLDLNIEFTPPPDLIITDFEAPPIGTAGQPLQIIYTLNNDGVGEATGRAWTDRFLLSADTRGSSDDLIIYENRQITGLAPGSAATDTIDVRIPMGAYGNYFLIAQADATNAIYEHFAENNNSTVRQIQIVQQTPADLTVNQVNVPDSLVVGQDLQMSWITVNQGAEPAKGRMTEAVYLSEDTTFDPDDLLIYQQEQQINLAPGQLLERSINQRIEGVDADLYYPLVYTDVRNNIAETDEDNNVARSASFLEMQVENLEIGITKDTLLTDKFLQYYQIFIPDSLAGETLSLRLESDEENAFNEVYLRFGSIPDRINHDYRQETPFLRDQEVLIPLLNAGVYFVTIYGDSQGNGIQAIQITPEILPFALSKIDTNTGGNSGSVTVSITGSRFDPDIAISLQNGADTILADTVRYQDPTEVFATFDLNGQPPGWYNVIGISRGDTATLMQAFSIEAGQTSIELDWVSVNVTRPNRVVPVTILLTNTGNVDIPAQDRLLLSERGAPIAAALNRLEDEGTILNVQFAETDGPEGILRPGAVGKVIIFSKATLPLKFRLIR